MKKFITTAFCVTLLLSGFEKIYPKNCNSSSKSSCNSKSNSCDIVNSSSSSNSCNVSFDNCSNNSCENSCENSCNNSCNKSCSESCGSESNSCEGDCSLCCATPVRTVFHPRSQGANTARELVGWQWEINLPFMCNNWGAAYFVYEYQRSFNDKILANVLFGGKKLRFAGSLVPASERTRNDLLAENFGLAQNFQGSIKFNPQMQNHIFDFGYFQGLDQWVQGFYLRVHAPVVLSYWGLRPCQNIISRGNTEFSPCFVESINTESNKTASSILEALSGDFLFGDMQTKWCAGKFDPRTRKRLGLADIDFILGYNYLNTDCYHLGLYAQFVLPSGPKYRDKYIFDPVVGNFGHFEAGVGISGHVIFFSGENQSLAAFIEGNVTHMVKTRECRLFDFQGAGAFSRYVILKQYDYAGNYTGKLINASCFNNRPVDVELHVKGDFSVKLAYRACGWGIDLGYNLYGHSSESVKLKTNYCDEKLLHYAIKGTSPVCCSNYPVICVPKDDLFDQYIYPNNYTDIPSPSYQCKIDPDDGFGSCSDTNPVFKPPYTVTKVKNNGAQPKATAFSGKPVIIEPSQITCSVCLNQPVTRPTTITDLEKNKFILINNITPTKFVSSGDFNLNSARSIGVLTHKIFAFFNYQWFDKAGWNPALGIGGSCEFNDKHINDLNCKNAGLSQWGVLTKWNISF